VLYTPVTNIELQSLQVYRVQTLVCSGSPSFSSGAASFQAGCACEFMSLASRAWVYFAGVYPQLALWATDMAARYAGSGPHAQIDFFVFRK
jgi:hypothetical protein